MTRTLILTLVAVAFAGTALVGQSGAQGGEWPTYGGDLGHTRYSPLAQIDASNFSKLEPAWRFKTDNLGPRPEFQLESTPLMVGGRRDIAELQDCRIAESEGPRVKRLKGQKVRRSEGQKVQKVGTCAPR